MTLKDELFVCGIGASAGGIQALETMFRAVPEHSGLAFVIVAHLASGRESLLVDIVARFTPLAVSRAADGEAVVAEHVYIIPPDRILTIRDGRLHLRDVDPMHRERYLVDAFLGSLATDLGSRAIAVILSGSGSDGTLGLKAVKEAGGLTVAQGGDHDRPRYSGMPTSAIATGLVDLVLPAPAIAAKLTDYVRDFGVLDAALAIGDGAADERPERARGLICQILRDETGHDFAGYKEKTFMRRVQRRMQVLQLGEIDAYVERLRSSAEEVRALFRDLLINVTSFFRDEAAFEVLERQVVPAMFEGKGADDTVRVWVPGCSTGEEVYSIAIILREHMDGLKAPPKVQVFASDIDEEALEAARGARFPAVMLEGMSAARRERFFTDGGGTYLLAKRVRDMCIFSAHSIIRDPPFRRIDLISCRNLLIYLGSELQARIVPVFHYALRSGGFLFLGSAEHVTQHRDLFSTLDKRHRLFRRVDNVEAPIEFPLFPAARRRDKDGELDARQTPGMAGLALRRVVEAQLLEQFAPAHVVVDRHGEAVYHSARTGKYFELPAGEPTRQIMVMARKDLRLDLRQALGEAVETRRVATRPQIAIEVDDGLIQLVTLTVAPLPGHGGPPLFMVLFTDLAPLLTREEAGRRYAPSPGSATDTELEREIRDTRERLQSTIEEYETAIEEVRSTNEELISLNEELQSTNEELETSKEETQSVNEELNTVNQELAHKLEQLDQANNDLRNLFDSTRIAIVFLDRDLIIRSFTPAMSKLFSLIPGDRGRPLADITSHLDEVDLQDELRRVLTSGATSERQVSRRDGSRHFLMRILPYQTGEGGTAGIVVTFVDITALVAAERQQHTLVQELNHRVRNMLAVIMAIAGQTLARTPGSAEFAQTFMGRVEALGRAYGLLAREHWGDVSLDQAVRGALEPHQVDGEERIVVRGPQVLLRPKTAVAFGMIFHELATNATKYGALSGQGRVVVEWRIEERQEGQCLHFCWREEGGPEVRGPRTRGFGSRLIEAQFRHDLGGEVTVDYRPQGLTLDAVIAWQPELLG